MKQIHEGEWVKPVHRGYRLGCCDCGLVHRVDFKIKRGRVRFRVHRDPKATKRERRRKRD